MMTNVMAKTCLNQKITKNSNFHDLGNEEERISESECYPKAEFFRKRICPNIYRMFRSVDWTHDMTIVKWHLAQTLRSDKCATGSIHRNGSMTINVIPC